MKPQLPISQIPSSKWNLVEAGGCRIACFENEQDAADALAIFNSADYAIKRGLQVTFHALMVHSLLTGTMRQAQAQNWISDDLPVFVKTYNAVLKHMELERGDNPFNLFRTTAQCCYIEGDEFTGVSCDKDAEYVVQFNASPDGTTLSCIDHVGHLDVHYRSTPHMSTSFGTAVSHIWPLSEAEKQRYALPVPAGEPKEVVAA